MRLHPAGPDHGIVFTRTDIPGAESIPARVQCVSATANATVLRGESGASVSTVEHLLAAAAGLGLDNLRVDLDGPEAPILDGSAAGYVAAIDAAGIVEQRAPRTRLRVVRRIEVVHGAKSAVIEPIDEGFEVDVTLRYEEPAIGVQRLALRIDSDTFRTQIAPARTFGRFADLAPLQARGLALGASLENTIAVDGDRIVNPEGLRLPDEFVRHKILDVIGDLALAGAPLVCRFVGDQCGHGLNAQALRTLLSTPDAYVRELCP